MEQAAVAEAATTIENNVETNPAVQNGVVENAAAAAVTSQQNGNAWSANAELANLPPVTPGELSEAEEGCAAVHAGRRKISSRRLPGAVRYMGVEYLPEYRHQRTSAYGCDRLLIERYGLESSAANEAGVFSNPDLQKLYDSLVARGSQSLAEAIKVGGAIEEIDILDLQKRLAQTDNADIQQVFNNLLRGSANHLKAFVNALQTQTGEVYQPQYMTLEAYQAILASVGGGRYGQGGGNSRSNTGAAAAIAAADHNQKPACVTRKRWVQRFLLFLSSYQTLTHYFIYIC